MVVLRPLLSWSDLGSQRPRERPSGLCPEEVSLEAVAEIDDEAQEESAWNEMQKENAFEDMFELIQSEQLQIVASMHRFMSTVRVHMDRHQKKVEGHHLKQLELLKSVRAPLLPPKLTVQFSNITEVKFIDPSGTSDSADGMTLKNRALVLECCLLPVLLPPVQVLLPPLPDSCHGA